MVVERYQRPHQTLPEVRDLCKRRKVLDNDVPTRINLVGHVGGGGGTAMYECGGIIP